MPTYEYVCSSCSNAWEEIQKISEDPIQVCPKCGESTAKRQISGGNFILKGGGWYADLYSSTKKSGGSSESSTSSSSESKSESKADTKPSGGDSGGGASTPAAPAKSDAK